MVVAILEAAIYFVGALTVSLVAGFVLASAIHAIVRYAERKIRQRRRYK